MAKKKNVSRTISVLKYPEDEDRDGPRNVGFFAIQPCDTAGNPSRFYYTWYAYTHSGVVRTVLLAGETIIVP
jgi:hypothetical protein